MIEQHRTAEVLLGVVEAGTWRPEDERLRAMVEIAAVLVEQIGYVDHKLALEALVEIDAEYDWPPHWFYVIESYRAREEHVDELRPMAIFLAAGKSFADWSADLEQRVAALLQEIADWRDAGEALDRMARTIRDRDVKPENVSEAAE